MNVFDFMSKILESKYSDSQSSEYIDRVVSSSIFSLKKMSEEKKAKIWMPMASYTYDFGTPELSVTLFLDENKDIMLADVMTDFKYQSQYGDADFRFFIWTRDDVQHYENIIVRDRKGYKQTVDALYHVNTLEDLIRIAIEILHNRDIPEDVDLTLTVDMATRMMFRRYKKILSAEDLVMKDTGVKEMSQEHLLWMCNQILQSDYPIDKMNRWLGFVQAALIVSGVITATQERDYSRPLFHLAYKSENIEIPPTVR